MSKGKLAKFADMERFENVFQYPYSVVDDVPFDMKGKWREMYFHNDNPIVLELGCGKGEYTVELAKLYPEMNFIGVDIKGARMWTGAKKAIEEGQKNVAFLRTNIEIIDRFFAEDEVQEIWLTFSDPQMKNPRKRLTSTYFMALVNGLLETIFLALFHTAIPIQPPPLRGTSFHRKEGASTRAPSLGRGCRAQLGGVGPRDV